MYLSKELKRKQLELLWQDDCQRRKIEWCQNGSRVGFVYELQRVSAREFPVPIRAGSIFLAGSRLALS